MRCSNCKTQNRDGSLLCERCGRSLTADSASLDTSSLNASSSAQASGHSSISVAPIQEPAATTASFSSTSAAAPMMPSAVAPAAPGATSFQPGLAMDTRQFVDGEAYKPSGRSGSGAGLKLLGSAVASGLLVGVVYHFIAQFIDLIILFPIIAGIVAGGILAGAVNKGKVRNPRLAVANGLICGLLVILTMQLLGAASVRSELVEGFVDYSVPKTYKGSDGHVHDYSASEIAAMQTKVRPLVESELTPLRTLMIYEQFRGEAGSEIKHNGVGSGVKMTGGAFWALEALESLLLVGMCISTASTSAKKPFCEGCDEWHKKTDVLKVHPKQNELIWPHIAAQNWRELLATPVGATMDSKHQTTLSVTTCPQCNHGTISAASVGGKVPQEFASRRLSPESARDLMQTRATPAA